MPDQRPEALHKIMDTPVLEWGTVLVRRRRRGNWPPALLRLGLLYVGAKHARPVMRRLSIATLAFVAHVHLSGCSVGMALVGKEESNRDVLREGVTRDEVEQHLGTPIISVTSPDGRRFSTYRYVKAKPSSPGRAVAYGVMDIFTLGLAEIGGTLRELAPKSSVTVTFARDDRVIAVSEIRPGKVDLMDLKAEYRGPKITPLADLGSVTVYQFLEKREIPNLIGEHVIFGRAGTYPQTIFSREPFSQIATMAFSEAVKARGYRVIDRTDTPFASGSHGGKFALTGEISDLWYESADWLSLFTHSAWRLRCTIVLQIYEVVSAQKFWEKTYSKGDSGNSSDEQGATRPTYTRNRVAQLLAEIIDEAVHDPEFVKALGGQ